MTYLRNMIEAYQLMINGLYKWSSLRNVELYFEHWIVFKNIYILRIKVSSIEQSIENWKCASNN